MLTGAHNLLSRHVLTPRPEGLQSELHSGAVYTLATTYRLVTVYLVVKLCRYSVWVNRVKYIGETTRLYILLGDGLCEL